MSPDRLATMGAWLLTISGAAAASRAALTPFGSTLPRAALGGPTVAAAVPALAYAVESLSAAVIERDPFRADRAPAAVAYDPSHAGQPAPVSPPKPALALSGIVWGAVPEAIVEGIPGSDGPRVMREGDVVAGLTLRKIEATRIVIAGMDTTWTLTVRHPWP